MRVRPVCAAAAFAVLTAFIASVAVHADDTDVSISLQPVRYAFVDGDLGKFRAHHWMREGYGGGIKDFSLKTKLSEDTEFLSEGHALFHDPDLAANMLLRNQKIGFVKLDFQEFRKYYDNTGPVYDQFSRFTSVDTDKELALDIGSFEVKTGLTVEGFPELSFAYGREYKDGAKTRLNLTPITEGNITRNIGPSWQDIDEIVDTFELEASHTLAGFELEGKQRWEFVRSELYREERSLSTNTSAATASQRKIRRQDQAPETILMTTTLGAERSWMEDKVFTATGYHFAHMDNREFESLLEFNENGVLTAFSSPKMQIDARADNDYDSHTWVNHAQFTPVNWLTLGTKLKSEVVSRESNSSYPADSGEAATNGGTPDGVIDRTDISYTRNKAVRWGEAFSARFSAIPRTALYTELELEQGRVLMREDRQSIDGPDTGNGSSAGEIFNRETVTSVRRGAFTLGGQVIPLPFVTLTSHARHRRNNNDYDDQRESVGSGGARSAFIDGQNVITNEFMGRVLLRPNRWFRASFRYQFRDDDYSTHAETEPIVKTGMLSNIYTYDVVLQPVEQITATASFSRQDAGIRTPAVSVASGYTPNWNADVNTWLLGLDVTPAPRIVLTQHLLYSRADNFNDFDSGATGLPLGVDFERVDLTTGVAWAVRDDFSVNAEYAFYHYQANSNIDSGDYDAHVIWLEASKKF